MAVVVLTNGRMYAGGLNLSGQTNKMELEIEADELDVSSIQDSWDATVLGRKRASLSAEGFWAAGAGAPDDLYALLGTSVPITVLPDGADGSVGYSLQSLPVKYTPVDSGAGDVMKFTLEAKGGVGRAVKGTVMHSDAVARTATGNGVARQLGAVSASQRVYAALHVIEASGASPTLNVVLASDDAGGFPSSTSRIAFTQATSTGVEWKELAGPITDDYWRIQYTIGGSTPSFKFVVLIAIL